MRVMSSFQATTEALSGYLEREDISEENHQEYKQAVQNKINYCETRRSALLKHVDEGNREDWWLYLKPEVKPRSEVSSWL